MNIYNKHIAIISSYEAPYGGNFIKILIALGNEIIRNNAFPYFIFPRQTEKDWIRELGSKFVLGFTKKPYEDSVPDLLQLFTEWHINLVHSHFDAYDIPIAKAIKKSGKDIKMVWHLHDYLTLDKTGLSFPWLRKILSNQKFWIHYGKWGKDAYYIGVSPEVTHFATHYRKHRFSYPLVLKIDELESKSFPKAEVIINGIDIERLTRKQKYHVPNHKTIFLSFAGECISKGIPCILDAADMLFQEGWNFELYLTRGYTLDSFIKYKYPKDIPEWLKIVEQTDDIVQLFDKCHCYISASLQETMSMAIAEASIYGLPIIQSDIPGTWWNAFNPSTFLFRTNNAQDLAKQMKLIINMDKEELANKVRQSSENNIKKLSMERWCKQIISVYQKI